MNIISAFPTNVEKGVPIAIIDGTRYTKLRTAAVGCVATKYLAPSKVNTIGFSDAGEEAKMYFVLLKPLFSTISECSVSSRSGKSEDSFIA